MTAPSITIEHVDPASLLVDHNVRSDVALDKDFLASIRDLGVLVPIVAVRTGDGALRVRYGKRRTLASVEVGRASVPVVVVGDEDADEIARIVAQWHENEHRAGLGTRDKLAAVEQLSVLGLSAGQIVKRTKARKADVEQALAASRSDLAKGAAQRYEFLTLDQAAAVAEFETDPATAKALVAAAHTSDGEFRHVLQRARDDREEAAQVAALTEQLTSDGVRIIERPDYGDRTIKAVADLVDEQAKPLTVSAHAGCPGHAAYIATSFRGVEATLVCTDWKTHGHRDRYQSSARPTSGPMDEKAKAERREVITRNKEWKSATAVRREFVTQLLTRSVDCISAARLSSADVRMVDADGGRTADARRRRWATGCDVASAAVAGSGRAGCARRVAGDRCRWVGGLGSRLIPGGVDGGGLFTGNVPLVCARSAAMDAVPRRG